MSTIDEIDKLELLRERLCLDFTNTTGNYAHRRNNDFLTSYERLAAWARYVDILTDEEAQHLLGLAEQNPDEAERVFQEAVALRETLYHILKAEAHKSDPSDSDMQTFLKALTAGLPHMRMVRCHEGDYVWEWAGNPDDLARVLWPVAWDAAELLKSDDLLDLRQCAAETCDWLFLDTSKNHSRRWCDMKSCGNRAKARTHYQRERATTSE